MFVFCVVGFRTWYIYLFAKERLPAVRLPDVGVRIVIVNELVLAYIYSPTILPFFVSGHGEVPGELIRVPAVTPYVTIIVCLNGLFMLIVNWYKVSRNMKFKTRI